MPASAAGRPSVYAVRVAPVDSPGSANEVSGQYIFTPASISMRLRRKEIEAVAEATFDIEIENTGKSEVTVALAASDRAGVCTYVFDLPRVRVNGRSSTVVRLTVTPPVEHRADARWEFTVEARPVNPPGAAITDTGVLIYGTPSVTLGLSPAERRGRRARKFDVALTNPTAVGMSVKVTARDNSGGLGVDVGRDTVQLPPSKSATVSVKVTPRKRQRGSGEASQSFTVIATPISPPGDAATTEGRFVALPARSRWIWLLLLAVIILALLFSPLYEQAFYATGWEKHRVWIEVDAQGKQTTHEKSGKHTFPGDVKCVFDATLDGDFGDFRNICFAQGPEPTGEEETNTSQTNTRLIANTPTPKP
jgi:hypothetical protein